MKKYLIYLFSSALLFLSAGIVINILTQNNDFIALTFIAVGAILFLLTIGIYLYQSKGFWQRRSTEAGTNALVATLAVTVIFILVNYLGFTYSWRVDWTENQLFTLSPQSQQLVKNLSQPIQIYVFDSAPNPNDRALLENYRRQSNQFSYEYVDPQINLSLAQQFGVQRAGEVYIKYEDRQQLVQNISPENPLTEVELTRAINSIQRPSSPMIYIIQGHGEPTVEAGENSFADGVNRLISNGYQVQPLNLTTSPLIPPDADVVILSSAPRPLLQGEVNALQQYVERGGSLLLMVDANTDIPLANLLTEWGISFDDGLVVDATGAGEIFGLGPAVVFVVEYGSHPITTDFAGNITLFPNARALISSPQDNIEVSPLMVTGAQTWSEKDISTDTIQFDEGEDLPGPLNLGYALVKQNPVADSPTPEIIPANPETPPEEVIPEGGLPLPPTLNNPPSPETTPTEKLPAETKMVVLGNARFATNGWLSQQLNGDLFANAVAWLGEDNENALSIAPKTTTNRRLNPSPWQVSLVSWLALVILPLLGMGGGALVWWRQR
ncbi:MAG: Gldg family protein [Cyanobacterium sp. T60_A2020_053]|nr:Gldg family protein [Cyanobacterium sp. T60_A2020_053]